MRRGLVCLALVAVVVCLAAPSARARDLTFDERVAAQQAIERVYWNHRIWPEENPGPKPPLSSVMPPEALRAKVEDYLKQSNALETWWQRPITSQQLQAEMDRMSASSHDGEILRELYAALGNDSHVIAETLARQTLSERLVRSWYAYDSRFHAEARHHAATAIAALTDACQMPSIGGEYSESTVQLESVRSTGHIASNGAVRAEELRSDDREQAIQSAAETFGTIVGDLQVGRLSGLREDPDRFFVTAIMERSADSLTIATVTWPKVSFDVWWGQVRESLSAVFASPSEAYSVDAPRVGSCARDSWNRTTPPLEGRFQFAAVWTGTEMILWGGGSVGTYLDTGWRYRPSTDSWVPISRGANMPSGRTGPTAVWTGSEVIVWGGSLIDSRFSNTGGRYSPSTDTWARTSTEANVPSGRYDHSAVWTGTEMIVWGGYDSSYGPTLTGGRYDPSTDAWQPTSTGANVPSARTGHTAVWTGSEMIIWGGGSSTGGRYDPSTDAWRPTSTDANVPSRRSGHTAVWTGSEMVVWGGAGTNYYDLLNTGGRYDPLTDSWKRIPSGIIAPAGRGGHSAVWTGAEMVIWGGVRMDSGNVFTPLNDGGRYSPAADSWRPVAAGANVPAPRSTHRAVWTGAEMIVWGGWSEAYLNTGGRYSPTTDSWVPTSAGPTAPAGREGYTAVWTGAEMVVWGGYALGSYFRAGGRYNPATDDWKPTGVGVNVPTGRTQHSAVWTGLDMAIWGGYAYTNGAYVYFNSGGRYNPITDTWSPTSAGTNVPAGRYGHTAVWTGTEMIVWGGRYVSSSFITYYPNSGGRYNPITNSWTATSTGDGVPVGREAHTAVWTGNEMVVWGGRAYTNQASQEFNTGGRYNPATNRWSSTWLGGNVPSERSDHTAVWTGSEMIVYGGSKLRDGSTFNTGGRYDPARNSWRATSTGANAPEPRSRVSAVWTGTEMIVWGGAVSRTGGTYWVNTGGRYDPITDSWSPTSMDENVPHGRYAHSAVWTGSSMLVWGGIARDLSSDYYLNTLGSYCGPANRPPVGSAGADQTIECTGDLTATATLDGSGSTDPDSTPGTNDDIGRFDWSEGGTPLASGMIVRVPFHLGSHDVTLTVTDRAGAIASDDTVVTVIDTTPPSIACPAAITAECQFAGQAYVSFAPATASDFCYGTATITNDRTPGGADASGVYPLGTTIVTFTATDGSGNHGSCQTAVTVRDTIPPVVTAVASPNVLWPPNHKMSAANTTVVATDSCDPSPSIVLASVTSSEPDDAPDGGDGQTTDDIQGTAIGTSDFQVLLRAERDGNGPGRTYTIAYQAFDHSGNSALASAQVVVPHDMSQGIEPLSFVMESARDTTLIWGPVEGARHYDVIRGDLANLRSDGSSVDLGQVVCIAPGTTATATIGYEDTAIPEPGEVFFYAVQYNDGREDSSYGSESAGRPRVVKSNKGDCS
jgi:hypothetical protein